MKLVTRNTYETSVKKENLAKFLAGTIEGGNQFSPYKPNENDDTFWTIDSANDWKVKFFLETPNVFEIIYRYQNSRKYEEALCGWLMIRINADTQEN